MTRSELHTKFFSLKSGSEKNILKTLITIYLTHAVSLEILNLSATINLLEKKTRIYYSSAESSDGRLRSWLLSERSTVTEKSGLQIQKFITLRYNTNPKKIIRVKHVKKIDLT